MLIRLNIFDRELVAFYRAPQRLSEAVSLDEVPEVLLRRKSEIVRVANGAVLLLARDRQGRGPNYVGAFAGEQPAFGACVEVALRMEDVFGTSELFKRLGFDLYPSWDKLPFGVIERAWEERSGVPDPAATHRALADVVAHVARRFGANVAEHATELPMHLRMSRCQWNGSRENDDLCDLWADMAYEGFSEQVARSQSALQG